MRKIIVAGGGHGGIGAAALLAKNGFDVTVFEKNPRDKMGYDWTDIFDKKGFTAIGMPIPPRNMYNLKNNMTFFPPNLCNSLTQHTPEDQLELQMERSDIYDLLISYAESCGVKFEFENAVLSPIVLGNRVCGINTEKGEYLADLVIDACGVDSPVRKNLPEFIGVQREAGKFEKFYVFRGFFERTAPIPKDNFRVHLLHNGILGISWVAIEEEHTDILIGRFDKFGMDEVEKELKILRQEQPALGEKLLRGGEFVTIPVRQPLSKMVADGYVAIGDSAFMTVPLIGSGIANSLKAAKILAEVVTADTTGFSEKGLYEYQKEFYKNLGNGLAPIACIKLVLTELTTDEVDYMFREGTLNTADITMGADSNSLWKFLGGMYPSALLLKGKTLAKNPALAKKLAGMVARIGKVLTAVYSMPQIYSPTALKMWTKAYDSCFILK